jgi:hypothetical protein
VTVIEEVSILQLAVFPQLQDTTISKIVNIDSKKEAATQRLILPLTPHMST